MGPPSHLYIQIGIRGLPTPFPWHAYTNMEIIVSVQYKHLEHTLYPFPTHFPRSSYTTSCVSATEDSKMKKYSHPQRAPEEHGPLCLSSGIGPMRKHGPQSLKGVRAIGVWPQGGLQVAEGQLGDGPCSWAEARA